MKILFIVPYYKPAYIYGGPIVVIAKLAEHLAGIGHQVTVYTTTANGTIELDTAVSEPVMVDGVTVKYFKRITKGNTHVSPALWRELWRSVNSFDVVHLHSWWNFLILGASMVCRMKGVKPILSPHGMLCDYIFTQRNRLPKQIIHRSFGKYLLSHSYLHVSSHMEWNECIRINEQWNGEMVFNLVDLPVKDYGRKDNDVFTISFLSRVDPKKGLDILFRALSKVGFNYRLRIAGMGEETYMMELKWLAAELDIEDKIEWVGWKNNEEKFHFLAASDLFALTSHNENFAVVVIESLFIGTPVFVSNNVGLSKYVTDNKLGWVTGITDVEEVKQNLVAAYHDIRERKRISESARVFIEHDFNENKLTNEYVAFYKKYSKNIA